jgi:hypothetical protein
MRARRISWVAVAMGCASAMAAASARQAPASGPGAASASAAPCGAAEYRQFDFWAGNWDVKDPSGQVVGTNRITREYDGCVLQEHWVALGPQKQTGSSFNTYSPPVKRWHQTWVDSTGGFLLLDGAMADKSMVLTGEMPARKGTGMVQHRIAFTPNANGTVRQLWEVSRDGGRTWAVNFDGTYVRKAD